VALTRQIESVKKQLIQATEEARAEREDRDAASVELKSLTQKLMEERSKHENFHRRAAELVRQVTDERASAASPGKNWKVASRSNHGCL
jgi:chromosome segregation ATPase